MTQTKILFTFLLAFVFLSSTVSFAGDNDSAQERARQLLAAKKAKEERELREKLTREQREKEEKEKQEKALATAAGQVYQGPSSGSSNQAVSPAGAGAKKDKAVEKAGFGLSIAACRKLASKDERRECVQEKNRKRHRRVEPLENAENSELKEFKEKRAKETEKIGEKPTSAAE